jgi:hypothetical protein
MKTLRQNQDRGFALLTSLIVVMVMTGVIVSFVDQVNTEQRIGVNDLDATSAFYAAEAGLEKQNADLAKLFQRTVFPTPDQLSDLVATGTRPELAGIGYPEYTIVGGQSTALAGAISSTSTSVGVSSTAGWPDSGYFMIDSEEFTYTGKTGTSFTGVLRGVNGTTAAAHGNGKMVSRSRVVTIAEGPNAGLSAQVIPFDLTVTANAGNGSEVRLNRQVQLTLIPVFQFGIFSDSELAFHAGPNFDFGGRVHTNSNLFLAQGNGTTLTLSQKVTAVGEVVRQERNNVVPNTTHLGTVRAITSPGNFRNLALTEGSVVAGPASATNPGWASLSLTTYNGNILNGDTGASPLNLPFVGAGAMPVEIVRRPPAAESPLSVLGMSRLANQASVRILLSSSAGNLPGGVGYPLNDAIEAAPYSYPVGAAHPPFAEVPVLNADFRRPDGTYDATGTPLIDGFLKVDIQLANGTWQDVTMEILNLGISTESGDPDAILRFQKLRTGWTVGETDPTRYEDLKLWDPREGEFRQYIAAGVKPSLFTKLGVMGIVELDVNNLRRWFEGTIGANGDTALNSNGYIVYFSDRRGNRNDAGEETGEFGFEDIVNPASVAGIPNGALDAGEDFNANGTLDTYGANSPLAPYAASTDLWSTRMTENQARKSKIYYFRRALRLVNGGGTNLPDPGFTVASENAVYIEGDYNADATDGFTGVHSAAAVIADTVKFLSNAWTDDYSFDSPHDPNPRNAATTWYRVALAAGKTINFPRPGTIITDDDFGGDGGVHNFFHYMEDWGGQNLNYLGSLVSLYYSHQMTGEMKCCAMTYSPPNRNFTFDVEFLVPALLPPGTPRFRDVNNLSFRQTITSD